MRREGERERLGFQTSGRESRVVSQLRWPDLTLCHLVKCGVRLWGQEEFVAARRDLGFTSPKKYQRLSCLSRMLLWLLGESSDASHLAWSSQGKGNLSGLGLKQLLFPAPAAERESQHAEGSRDTRGRRWRKMRSAEQSCLGPLPQRRGIDTHASQRGAGVSALQNGVTREGHPAPVSS